VQAKMVDTRRYKFAGSFYPMPKDKLEYFVSNAIGSAKIDSKNIDNAIAYQVPHAGYEYSGSTAAYAYKALMLNNNLSKIDTIVLIGPNHTGNGMPIAVSDMNWDTPLGIAKNDIELSKAIADGSDIYIDNAAHSEEHSLEVQLPFLQYMLMEKGMNKRYVFICMGVQDIDASRLLFSSIKSSQQRTKRNIIIIASSDLNHYESVEIAGKKDTELLKAMQNMDYIKLNKLIDELNISACGFGPITVAMMYASSMGASNGVILKYSNSGEQTGDYSSVVEYSAVAFV
jgi:AmmeMemoRadiSam system protein B